MIPAPFASLSELRAWLALAPSGTALDARGLLTMLDAIGANECAPPVPAPSDALPASWRERLWSASPETRLSVPEAAEALGRPVSFVYRHTSERTGLPRLPHRKLDGVCVFVVGELRAWIREHEEIVAAGPMDRAGLSLSARLTA